jgi:hypothetical protein
MHAANAGKSIIHRQSKKLTSVSTLTFTSMKIKFIAAFLVMYWLNDGRIFAQAFDTITIQWQPCFNAHPLQLDTVLYPLKNNDSITFETFKCYLSKIELVDDGKVVYAPENSFYLLDVAQPSSLDIALKLPTSLHFTAIQFLVGIDSTTNNAGALGGDLDPTKGMYWSWQSGYINSKIEGHCPLSPTALHDFQFHLGGYQYPFNAAAKVKLNTVASNKINISIDLKTFFDAVDISVQHHLMSPSEEAVTLAKRLATCFEIKN